MGILDLGYATTDKEVSTPLQTVPSTPGQRFGAEFSAAFAEDRYFNKASALADRAKRVIDDIHGATGERLPNPYEAAPTPEEMMRLGNQPAITAERLQKLREKATALRGMTPEEGALPTNYLDTDFEGQVARDATIRRQRAEELSGTGSGWAGFLGSMAGETLTPHGLISLAIPVTRAPTAASIALGETFLANVGKETAFQAVTNMGVQATAEAFDYASRHGSGTEQTAGEIAMNIGGAGVLSGVIGGGARAVWLKWLGLPESVRLKAPTEVKDAFRVIEGEALYAGGNRFGLPPDVHEKMIERSVADVMSGKPVQAADIWGTADTAMTALRRVLRGTEGGATPNINGLWDALNVVGRLPDEELEGFARQLKPRSFIAHDRLTREISTARSELAGMNRNLEAVTAADMVDPLTGARLADIDAQLDAKGLPARERNQLVRERDMIIQSVDTDGTLAKNLDRERAALETDAEKKKRSALETRLEKAEAELVHARGEVTREVDFLRGKLERLGPKFRNAAGTGTPLEMKEVAQELGVGTAADIERAAGRAEAKAAPVIAPRERLPEPKAPEREAAPDPAFEKKLRDEAELVWADKALMGKTHRNVRRNEDFAIEVARERIMRSENPNDVAIAIQKHDLSPEMVREISALYRRGAGERPQDAFNRAFNRWSDADKAEAIKFFGQLQEDLEFDPLAGGSGDPIIDEMFANLNRHYGFDDFDHNKIPFDSPTMQLEADQRAQAFLSETRAKPEDPELVKAQDLEVQRIIDNPAALGEQRAPALRELEAADLEVKDANAAAACVSGGAHL